MQSNNSIKQERERRAILKEKENGENKLIKYNKS